jgi:formylglycine-generating enzyme required for sulfatase activity
MVSRSILGALAACAFAAGVAVEGADAQPGRPAPRVEPGPPPGAVFRDRGPDGGDCLACPEMVVIPPGRFTIGVSARENERERVPREVRGHAQPQVEITIERPFALGRHEVTRDQYEAFVTASGHATTDGCYGFARDDASGRWAARLAPNANWRSHDFSQRGAEPVVCIGWTDATAYVQWLARVTGQPYRLPSEAEWEYAARAGTQSPRWWGELASAACTYANVADLATARAFNWEPNPAEIHMCDDGEAHIAPVGRYPPNPFGLHDMLGNVWEMVEDCWNPGYRGRPRDARPWLAGNCQRRIQRGGSWLNDAWRVRSGTRFWIGTGDRAVNLGFRVARSLPP